MYIQNFNSFYFRCSLILCLSICLFAVPSNALTEERDSIRQEIKGAFHWSTETSSYFNYIDNAEPTPSKSEYFEKAPWSITSTYTFFFSPLVVRRDLPIALWDFYLRSGKARLLMMVQPKAEVTNIHDDPVLGLHRHTDLHERLRTISLDIEHYASPQTGFSLNFASFRNDDDSQTRISIDNVLTQRTGENDGLRRKYRIGLSHYLSENVNLRMGYALMDGIYRGRDRSWAEQTPTLVTRYYTDSELTGHHFSFKGIGIVNTLLGIQGRYDFQSYSLKGDYLSVLPKSPASEPILFDDDMQQHNIGLQLSVYLGHKTTVRIDNCWTIEAIQRTYRDLQQIVDFDYQQIHFRTEIEHYISYTIGFQAEYGYLQRRGDVCIGKNRKVPPFASYDTTHQRHTFTISLIGRF